MAASTSTNRIQRVREKSLLRFAFRSRGQATRPTGQSRRTQIQRIRSRLCRRGFGLRRRRTSSWWRRTRFSSARSLRERQKSIRMRSSIERKPSTGAGAYQGRRAAVWTIRDRLLPPFSRPYSGRVNPAFVFPPQTNQQSSLLAPRHCHPDPRQIRTGCHERMRSAPPP